MRPRKVYSRYASLSAFERRVLVACGAGAGMAAVYNVPLAARSSIVPLALFVSLGAFACVFPQTLGNGKDLAQRLFANDYGLRLVAPLLAAKTIATLASLRTGAPGGIFTPTVSMRAAVTLARSNATPCKRTARATRRSHGC